MTNEEAFELVKRRIAYLDRIVQARQRGEIKRHEGADHDLEESIALRLVLSLAERKEVR